MTLELWNTIFAGATFAVIAATAIAALVQLRHLRASNQLAALLTILEQWKDPQLQEYISFVRHQLTERMKDPQFRADYAGNADRHVHLELHVCDWWEQIGSFLKYGLIDEAALMDTTCWQVSTMWGLLWPSIKLLREKSGPSAYENFEYMAVKGTLWMRAHPSGSYPKSMPRMADLPEPRSEA
jgi:hypothetical protein